MSAKTSVNEILRPDLHSMRLNSTVLIQPSVSTYFYTRKTFWVSCDLFIEWYPNASCEHYIIYIIIIIIINNNNSGFHNNLSTSWLFVCCGPD